MCSFKDPRKGCCEEKIANLIPLTEDILNLFEENQELITVFSKKEAEKKMNEFYFLQSGKLQNVEDIETELKNILIFLENLKGFLS